MNRVRGLDLSSHAQVSASADHILGRLQAKSMPCDGAWPDSQITLFAKGISDGKLP